MGRDWKTDRGTPRHRASPSPDKITDSTNWSTAGMQITCTDTTPGPSSGFSALQHFPRVLCPQSQAGAATWPNHGVLGAPDRRGHSCRPALGPHTAVTVVFATLTCRRPRSKAAVSRAIKTSVLKLQSCRKRTGDAEKRSPESLPRGRTSPKHKLTGTSSSLVSRLRNRWREML